MLHLKIFIMFHIYGPKLIITYFVCGGFFVTAYFEYYVIFCIVCQELHFDILFVVLDISKNKAIHTELLHFLLAYVFLMST